MRSPESFIENIMGFRIVSDSEGSFAPVIEEMKEDKYVFFHDSTFTLTSEEMFKLIFD